MNTDDWTYGAEIECADWRGDLPKGCTRNTEDHTMVNSNGIAVDPTMRFYAYGGEINTRPTKSIAGQINILREFVRMHPEATINYRCNLHVHIGIPGLAESLPKLKRIQAAAHHPSYRKVLQHYLDPIPKPTRLEYSDEEHYKGALKRYRRRKVSHQYFLSEKRLRLQAEQENIDRWFDYAMVLHTKTGKPQPAISQRLSVNILSIREHGTVEFRHFPGTLNPKHLLSCFLWGYCWLKQVLIDKCEDAEALWNNEFQHLEFPRFQPYNHWMETRYQQTYHNVYRSNKQRSLKHAQRIAELLAEDRKCKHGKH